MRQLFIVHIGNYLLSPNSGVYQKYQAIYQAMCPHVSTRLIAFTDQILSAPINHVEVVKINKSNKWSDISIWMEKNLGEQDVVWLRYPFASKGLFELTQKYGSQIVLEHNTNEIAEAVQIQKQAWLNARFGWKKVLSRSFWKYTWNTWISNQTDEAEWGVRCLSNVKGGISVTFELAEMLHARWENYQVMVLPNCISTFDFKWMDSAQKTRGDESIKLAMMIGSFDYWQGWERILRSAQVNLPIQTDIELDIYGEIPPWENKQVNKAIRIRNLPALTKSEMQEVLPHYDMGIGTLELFRKQMSEACPLKVRDYWRLGIPCLLAYNDTAVVKYPKLKEFNYFVPNDNSILPWNDIIEFIKSKKFHNQDAQEVIEITKNAITYEAYAQEMADFLFKK